MARKKNQLVDTNEITFAESELLLNKLDIARKKQEIELHNLEISIKAREKELEYRKLESHALAQDADFSYEKFRIEKLIDDRFDIKSRTIIIQDEKEGEVDEDMCLKFHKAMTTLESISNEPILIRLNTGGGRCSSAFSMIDRILNSPCKIHIHASGSIMSMGIYILASGNTRSASFMTDFMHHEISNELIGRLSDLQMRVNDDTKFQIKINKFLSSRTNMPFDFWMEEGKKLDHYFDAEKALEYGLISEIK